MWKIHSKSCFGWSVKERETYNYCININEEECERMKLKHELHFGASGSDMTVCLVLFPAHWQQVQSHVIFLAVSPWTPPRNLISLLVTLSTLIWVGINGTTVMHFTFLAWWDTPWCLHHQLLIQSQSHCRSSGPWWDQLYFRASGSDMTVCCSKLLNFLKKLINKREMLIQLPRLCL